MTATTAVVLFTRDLRVADHPALATAVREAGRVVPLFVVDPAVSAGPNRFRFLAECLTDLRRSLRERGADLLVRQGDPVAETISLAREVGATAVHATADASGYARRRQDRLAAAGRTHRIRVGLHPGVTVVPPGELRPTGSGDHYRVFTPYWRSWQARPRPPVVDAPERIALPTGVRGDDPARALGRLPVTDADLPPGGETAGRERLAGWAGDAARYADDRDTLAVDGTSRLSAYLHFGCVSPGTVLAATGGHEEFVRQVCWRDFYQQVLWGFPELRHRAYRPGADDDWHYDADLLAAWCSGHTGIPVVDAGMRQLAARGWLHNRARLITASFLTKTLGLDWRDGARWYDEQLVDADVGNNYGNWQWMAGTGNDTRPYRKLNPIRQAHRFDPDGEYVRRWVPELADVAGPAVHEPWRLPAEQRRQLSYPPPVIDPPGRGR